MLIIGGIEDNINRIVWSQISDQVFKITSKAGLNLFQPYQDLLWSFTHPWTSNQPISSAVFSIVLSTLKFNGYYLLFLFTALLNIYFSYVFFKKYKNGWIYTLLFSFTTYFWVHLWNHLDLAQIWLIPWVLKDLIDYHSEKNIKLLIKAATKIIIAVLISNYIGFGLLLTLGLYLGFTFFAKEIGLKKLLALAAIPAIVLTVILFPYVKTNFFSRKYDPSLPKIGYVSRGIGDFVTFSSRPWYYVIPFPKNIITGKIGTNIYDDLKNTNHYLLDDYFQGEHAANYYGLPLILLSVLVLLKRPKQKHYVEWLMMISLFILTMPPFFTVFGTKIYLPSYLIFSFAPMFRVTARLSTIALFLLLYLIAENIDLKSKKLKYIFVFFMLLNLVDTFVPIGIVDAGKYSAVYDYMRLYTPAQSKFVAYPFSLTKDAYLHVPQHQRLLVNSRNYNSDNFNGIKFNSEQFTNALVTNAGQKELKDLDVKYLLLDKKYEEEFIRTSGLKLSLVNNSNDLVLYEITY